MNVLVVIAGVALGVAGCVAIGAGVAAVCDWIVQRGWFD